MLSLAIINLIFSSLGVAEAIQCRCTYHDACWPTAEDFADLQRQVSQSLIHPFPPAKPCYVNASSADCAAVANGWTDGNWRANQPGAMEIPNFETFTFQNGTIDACYVNLSLGVPCTQGSVPPVGVDVLTVGDVQAAIIFAAKHNLRLVVKNTGHDFLGRSTGRGSFVIWTHHLKNITIHPVLHPAGAPLTEEYDHGVDNVVEISLVTSTGAYLTANAHQHANLFWALRGGGGGTYGVVTSVTYRTRLLVPVIATSLIMEAPVFQSNSSLGKAFTELVRITPTLTDAGWGGYNLVQPTNGNTSFTLVLILPNVSWAEANATINPYLDYVRALVSTSSIDDPLTISDASTIPFSSFYAWYDTLFSGSGGVGGNIALGSWLLPRDCLERDYEAVSETLINASFFNYYLVAGGAVSRTNASSTGLNPAWRKANAHAILGVTWPEGTTAEEINRLHTAGIRD
ncbi:hypothetical protein BN946_scf184804.g16 [Trametes cinnabarina]|uniref:FAD-binding PCMH-type domain-containing protein n=1 Tax=Pycnoporus cinnabarinus TaxID=5643 RepID=A0A060SF71_PYCCI|nr:hypothetical protein BN946_scf184804.g16 [Trametes cinnabarina]